VTGVALPQMVTEHVGGCPPAGRRLAGSQQGGLCCVETNIRRLVVGCRAEDAGFASLDPRREISSMTGDVTLWLILINFHLMMAWLAWRRTVTKLTLEWGQQIRTGEGP
jgi:hypothetical protein